jgi:hypothetical protein
MSPQATDPEETMTEQNPRTEKLKIEVSEPQIHRSPDPDFDFDLIVPRVPTEEQLFHINRKPQGLLHYGGQTKVTTPIGARHTTTMAQGDNYAEIESVALRVGRVRFGHGFDLSIHPDYNIESSFGKGGGLCAKVTVVAKPREGYDIGTFYAEPIDTEEVPES